MSIDWKAEAISKLRAYDQMKMSLANIPDEIAILELELVSIRGVDPGKERVASGGNRREDALLSNMVRREELRRNLDRANTWVKQVDRGLGTLDPEERLILHRLYIYPVQRALESLCRELSVEQSSIYRKRDRALKKFTLSLYGIGEA